MRSASKGDSTISQTPPLLLPAPFKLQGVRAALSVQQSKAILARLSSHSKETGVFDRHLAVEEAIAGNPLVVGNRTTLFADGESTYAAMFKAIDVAKHNINVETYIIEDDEIGLEFLQNTEEAYNLRSLCPFFA